MDYQYRKNVGIVVCKEGLVLMCARADSIEDHWQFPQGGIDEKEDIVTAAKRELFEETGFDGKVLFTQSPSYSSPGMTGESVILTVMEIDGSRYEQGLPEAHPEECEHIEVFRVKVAELADFVAEQENAGCGIDSKIYTYLAMRRIGF